MTLASPIDAPPSTAPRRQPLKVGIVSPYGYPHPGGVNQPSFMLMRWNSRCGLLNGMAEILCEIVGWLRLGAQRSRLSGAGWAEVGIPFIRSSPRKRGPRLKKNWIPACAGMSGACGTI